MRIELEEAFDMFRKWEAEHKLLLCHLGFPQFAAAFRARISKLSSHEIGLLSDDKHSEFAMPFKPEMTFFYEDARRTPEEADLYECGVLITFDRDTFLPAEELDHIGFTEVKE